MKAGTSIAYARELRPILRKHTRQHLTCKTEAEYSHLFLALRILQEEGKIVGRPRTVETMLKRFQMDQCKPSRTQIGLNLKLQIARRQRSGPKELQKLGWITFLSGQTDEATHHVHSQHSVQTHKDTYQSTPAIRKSYLCDILKVQMV